MDVAKEFSACRAVHINHDPSHWLMLWGVFAKTCMIYDLAQNDQPREQGNIHTIVYMHGGTFLLIFACVCINLHVYQFE